MMSKSSFIAWFLVLFTVHVLTTLSIADNTKNFITWNDLRISHNRSFGLNDSSNNPSRIIVVNHNGSGDYRTVQDAVNMVPEHNTERIKIHILPGVYIEKVKIPKTKPYISFIGDENNAHGTVITWHDKAGDLVDDRGRQLGTQNAASVIVDSDYFCATGITFENTIVQHPKVVGCQAPALRISGDRAVFYKVRFIGEQDTLYDHRGSHYFHTCYIQGRTDFICGDARSLYQNCTINVGKHGFAIAAHHRDTTEEDTGYSFVNSTITGKNTSYIYLGRSWGDYARIIFSFCEYDVSVRRERFNDMGQTLRKKTAFFGEHECRGIGASVTQKRTWFKNLEYEDVKPFLSTSFINGDDWLRLN